MSLTNEQIIEAIGQKTVLEIVELIKAMEETFGVTAAAAVAAALLVALLPLLKSRPSSTSFWPKLATRRST